MCIQMDFSLHITNECIFNTKYTLQNNMVDWTLLYLEEVYHSKLPFKYTSYEDWTLFTPFLGWHVENQWKKIIINILSSIKFIHALHIKLNFSY
jgi:hypothetical protein